LYNLLFHLVLPMVQFHARHVPLPVAPPVHDSLLNLLPLAPVAIAAILVILGLPALLVVTNYNGLVRARNAIRESWADIDTELKRRYNLIPNLVATVQGYAAHEREVLQRVVEARTRAVASTGSPVSQATDENVLVQALRQVFAVAEGYPQLKADGQFLALQKELVNTEDRIQTARRFYNANVRDYNNRCQALPSSLVASVFKFVPAEFFEIESVGERAPAASSLNSRIR
jgi:LemA protein